MNMSVCIKCGSSDLETRRVEKIVRAKVNAAVVKVDMTVCRSCNERYLGPDAIHALDNVKKRLMNDDLAGFESLGHLFVDASC